MQYVPIQAKQLPQTVDNLFLIELLALLAMSCEQATRDFRICTVHQKNLPVIVF